MCSTSAYSRNFSDIWHTFSCNVSEHRMAIPRQQAKNLTFADQHVWTWCNLISRAIRYATKLFLVTEHVHRWPIQLVVHIQCVSSWYLIQWKTSSLTIECDKSSSNIMCICPQTILFPISNTRLAKTLLRHACSTSYTS